MRTIFHSLLSAPVWVICIECSLLLFHLFHFMRPLPILSDFLLFSVLIVHIFFQCDMFTYTFYATIFSDFFFFSAQCSHIPADVSLCGPRGRSPNNRLWFRLPGKTLTQLAHDYVNQVFLLIVLKFKIGWKLYFKVSTNNLLPP